MYRMRVFLINLSVFLSTFYPFYESPVPPPPKEEDMELTLPSIGCDCVEEGWRTVLELLNNEDLIWLLFISGFFSTFFLWLVTTWLQKRQEKASYRPYKPRKLYKTRRGRNIPFIASDLRSEDEIVIKSKEDTETNCLREPVTPANLITGDHIDGTPYSYENSQEGATISEITPISTTLKLYKSPKRRTSKSYSLRVDPVEYRKKHQKKSPRDLNVAFGSRLSTPRIGDFSCQVSPAMTPPMFSPARSSTNFSLISSGKRPDEEKGNFRNENVSQNSSTSSGKSIK